MFFTSSISYALEKDLPPSYEEAISALPPSYEETMGRSGTFLEHRKCETFVRPKIHDVDQKLSFPRAILGQWKFGNYSMILSANMSDGFVIKRCHLGDVIFNPSEIEWKGEKFHWEMKKFGNHTTDSHYCYDPSIPNTIIETNSGSRNTFTKLKL